MKSSIIINCIIFLATSYFCKAQEKVDQFSLERKVVNSNYIIEGEVLKREFFLDKDSNIYTAAFVRVSRIFKGENIDSIIEIVYVGGYYEGISIPYQMTTHSLNLVAGEDGILFLNRNNSKNKKQDSLQSYLTIYGRRGFIHYQGGDQAGLETGIYKDIAALTGQKIKVIGQNTLERPPVKSH
jgi:hypothetical protein